MDFLSVVVITFNEEKNIARCLDSVQAIADEIIVLDSYSTDNTLNLAREKKAIVHQQPFKGYIEQKNSALDLATYPYVLSLDADEALDARLIRSIADAKKKFSETGYTMNRCSNYCGRFIRHGLWYPDKKLRLFNKKIARWGGTNPHDKIEMQVGSTTSHLKGDILHFSYSTIDDHIAQNNKFSSISALEMFHKGKRSSWYKILIHPVWTFILGYILRLGFLDGYYGFLIAINTAHLTFLKYSKLLQMQRSKKNEG
ncbi:MAG TPA: glycosyltransferase family 2 protein [Flavitalea sp.]|nr:glycosyltransferase family 2 protein [Flavitalea sp.]